MENLTSKKRVWVIMGGLSTEHPVSCISGREMIKNLDPHQYDVIPVLQGLDNLWYWKDHPLNDEEKAHFDSKAYFAGVKGVKAPGLNQLPPCDIALLGLHGKFGEDGHIQALLEYWGVPYTGSGVLGSALAMHKIKTKQIYHVAGIPTPRFKVLYKDHPYHEDDLMSDMGLPLVIKDPLGGSSIGMGIAFEKHQVVPLIEKLFESSRELLVEEYIKGEEGSCGYLEGGPVLPPTEIVTDVFFDYEAKYLGKSREITPGRFSESLTQQIQGYVRRCHEALGLSVYSRSDFIIKAGQIFFLETNTLPGFTPASLLPQAAAHVGYNYSKLLDFVISKSLEVKRT